MSERPALLQVRAAGRDLLLSVADLREVVVPTPVTRIPGAPLGIQGVVVYQGEFLPVLAWGDLPGCPTSLADPMVLAVTRRRLGIPLDRLRGTLETPGEGWSPADEQDPWNGFISGRCHLGGGDWPLLDLDRLLALLNQLRKER